jgi:hypothetical protein
MKPARLVALSLLLAAAAARGTEFEHAIIDPAGPADPWVKIAADLDGDGRADVAIGGRSGPLVWYAAPDWKKREIARGGYRTVDGEAADIDGDGDLDLVAGELWYENPRPGADGAEPWKAHRIGTVRTHDVEVGDLDGDGRLDVAARDQSGFGSKAGNKIHLWFREAGGSWEYRELACPHGEGLRLADLDRDGDLDILIGSRWSENPADARKDAWSERIIARDWHEDAAVDAGDIDGDGRLDVALSRSEGEYRLSWFQAPADPRAADWKEHVIDASLDFAHGLALADLDGDGDLDVTAAEMHQSKRRRVMVYINEGRGSSWSPRVLATTGSHNLRLADLDGDGRPDILGANWSGPHQPIESWLNRLRRP